MCYEPHFSRPGLVHNTLMRVCRKILVLKWNKSLQNSFVCLFGGYFCQVASSMTNVSGFCFNFKILFYVVICLTLFFIHLMNPCNENMYSSWKLSKYISNKPLSKSLFSRLECLFQISLSSWSQCGLEYKFLSLLG